MDQSTEGVIECAGPVKDDTQVVAWLATMYLRVQMNTKLIHANDFELESRLNFPCFYVTDLTE